MRIFLLLHALLGRLIVPYIDIFGKYNLASKGLRQLDAVRHLTFSTNLAGGSGLRPGKNHLPPT